jgi:hypothetical protein
LNHKFEDGEDDDECYITGKSGGNVLEPPLLELLKSVRKTVKVKK